MFLGMNLDDAQELKTVPAGEYQLQIISAEEKTSEKAHYLIVRLSIMNQSLVKKITQCLFFIQPDDDADARNSKMLRMKYFATAFGFDFKANVDVNALSGATGWALLKEVDKEEYGMQNEITRFVSPKS